MALLQQSTTYTRTFLMVLSSDHVSAATGKTVTVNLSKAGGTFAAAGGTVTEIGSGWYKVALTTTDTNTLGDLSFDCTASGCDNTDFADQVVAFNPLNANLGLTNVSANVAQWNGSNVSAPATAGIPDVNVKNYNNVAAATDANNLPKVDVEDWKATAVSAPATAGIPDVNAKNINNVATSSVTTVNANIGTTQPLNFTGTGASALLQADTRDFLGQAVQLDGNNLPKVDVADWLGSAPNALNAGRVDAVCSIRSGTAQAGAASTITLDSGASATNNLYQDAVVFLTGGTGAGQVRSIQSYVGSTKVATVFPNWTTNPDNTSTFTLIPMGQVDVGNWLNGTIPAPNVTGTPVVDVVDWKGGTVPAPNVTGVPKVDVVDWLGQTPPTPTVTGVPQVDVRDWIGVAPNALVSGNVPAQVAAYAAGQDPVIRKNTALSAFPFLMISSSDHVTPKTGLGTAVTCQRSLDGAAFAACANTNTELANGIYLINLAATDTNANTITFRFSATGADDTFITVITQP